MKLRRAIELDYQRTLKQIFKLIKPTLNFKTQVEKILKSKEFNKFIDIAVQKMINKTKLAIDKDWRSMAGKSPRGRQIYESLKKDAQNEIMRELLKRNVKYIKSAPIDIAERFVNITNEMTRQGKRPEEIEKHLKAIYPSMSNYKAKLIARTESSKANAALTESRAKKLRINWYEWDTSGDARVRKSHKNMNGVLVNYNNPPSPEKLVGEKSYGEYNPGEIFNCRCVALPVVDVNTIKFPKRVFHNGRIKLMTKSEFERIM